MIEQFRFQNLTKPVIFSQIEKEYINKLPLKSASEWDLKDPVMLQIKETIKSQLMKNQNGFCIYCGLPVGIVGSFDREHIAPKGKNPEFMFTPHNLALACKTCNGPTKKGQTKIIEKPIQTDYDLNKFCIIHPFLDKREEHLDYAQDNITFQAKTTKGAKTIEIFDLNNSALLNIRGAQYILSQYGLTNTNETIVEIIMNKTYEK